MANGTFFAGLQCRDCMHSSARPAESYRSDPFLQFAPAAPCTISAYMHVCESIECMHVPLENQSPWKLALLLLSTRSRRGLLLFALRRIKKEDSSTLRYICRLLLICFRHCTRRWKKNVCVCMHRKRAFFSVCPGTWAPRQTRVLGERERGVCLFLFVAHGECLL